MWRGSVRLIANFGHQIANAYRAITDPHNLAVVLTSLVLLSLATAAFYLLITSYDALLRLARINLSCSALSNNKAVTLIICGMVFGVSTPLTIGEALLHADAKRKKRRHGMAYLMGYGVASIASGTLLVSLAIGFC